MTPRSDASERTMRIASETRSGSDVAGPAGSAGFDEGGFWRVCAGPNRRQGAIFQLTLAGDGERG